MWKYVNNLLKQQRLKWVTTLNCAMGKKIFTKISSAWTRRKWRFEIFIYQAKFFPSEFCFVIREEKSSNKYILIRLWVAPRVIYFFRSRNRPFQLRPIKFIDRKPRNFDGIDMQVVSYGWINKYNLIQTRYGLCVFGLYILVNTFSECKWMQRLPDQQWYKMELSFKRTLLS